MVETLASPVTGAYNSLAEGVDLAQRAGLAKSLQAVPVAAYEAGKNLLLEGVHTADRWVNATHQLPGARPTDTLVAPAGTEDYSINPNRVEDHDTLAPLGLAGLGNPVSALGRAGARGAAEAGRPSLGDRVIGKYMDLRGELDHRHEEPTTPRAWAIERRPGVQDAQHPLPTDPQKRHRMWGTEELRLTNASRMKLHDYDGRIPADHLPDELRKAAQSGLRSDAGNLNDLARSLESVAESKASAIEDGSSHPVMRGAANEPGNPSDRFRLLADQNRSSWLGQIANALMGRDEGRASVGASRETVRPSLGAEGLPTEAAASSISRPLNQGIEGAGRNVEKVTPATERPSASFATRQQEKIREPQEEGAGKSEVNSAINQMREKELVRLWREAKESSEDIAGILGVAPGWVNAHKAALADAHGLENRRGLGVDVRGRYWKENSSEFERMWKAGASNVEMQQRFDLSPAAVSAAARRLDLSVRRWSPNESEVKDQVKALRSEGMSYTDISKELNITRNSVAGIVDRLRKGGTVVLSDQERASLPGFLATDSEEGRPADASRQNISRTSSNGSEQGQAMAEQGTDPFDAEIEALTRMLADGGGEGAGGGGVDGPPRTVPNPNYTLGGRRMEGRRPMTIQEQTMADNPALQMGRDAGAAASSAVDAAGFGLPGVLLDYAAPNVLAGIRENEALANPGVPFAGSIAGSMAAPVNSLARGAGAAADLMRAAPKTSTAALGIGGVLTTPSEAGKATLDPRQDQIGDLRKEQDAARKILEKFATQNFQSKTARDNASKPYLDQISSAQTRIDALTTAMDKDAEDASNRGRPIREYLPPALANTLPIWAGVAGGLLARRSFNKYNAEYNSALEGYRGAEKTGDAAEMAIRKNQLAGLETNTPWKDPSTYLAAGLPLELRGMEHVIDANRDPSTRAYQEAQTRIHDPAAVAFDVGTGLFSSATALGLGAKLSKAQPERSLGRAIASENAYGDAPKMAEQLGTALRAGEDLKALRPSSLDADPARRSLLQRLFGTRTGAAPDAPLPATVPSSSVEVLPPLASRNALAGPAESEMRLSDRVRANPVPEPARLPSPSNRPDWASDPPQGYKLDKGYYWDAKMQRQRHADGTWGEQPKYSAPRGKRE